MKRPADGTRRRRVGRPVGRRLAGLAALAALAAAPLPAAAQLAFTALVDGVWTLHVQGAPGTPPRPLRPDLGLDASAPALADDGSTVAFEVAGDGVLVCALGGGECRRLPSAADAVRPAWEPGSGELVFVAFSASAAGEDSDLHITRRDLAESGPLLLQTGVQDTPDFFPDGTRLVYSSAQTVALQRSGAQVVRHLWVLDLRGGRAWPLTTGAAQDMQPDVSPDGARVAFASDRGGRFDIWVVDAAGGEPAALTSGEGTKTWPAWSPDGRSLAFTRTHEGRDELWTVGADGTGERPLAPFGPAGPPARDADWR